jgi:hypothetical protein
MNMNMNINMANLANLANWQTRQRATLSGKSQVLSISINIEILKMKAKTLNW